MFKFKSLNQRLSIFMLLPVGLLLVGMGYAGYTFAQKSILAQWRESTILKLQKTAHLIDMRLNRPKEWIEMLHLTADTNSNDPHIQPWVIEQIKKLEGVKKVSLESHNFIDDTGPPAPEQTGSSSHLVVDVLHDHAAGQPHYLNIATRIHGSTGSQAGIVKVQISFDYLFKQFEDTEPWYGREAYIIDEKGYIIHSSRGQIKEKKFYSGKSTFREKTYNALNSLTYGTIIGAGHPPEQVSGFYQISEAPWTLVMIASGKDILSPLINFQFFYTLSGVFFIALILMLIRSVSANTVASIKKVSKAAESVAKGNYDNLPSAQTNDEVGELIRNFNSMVHQLEDRMRLKEALNLAVEVQQNFLPSTPITVNNIDIAGQSIYYHETGGDYYDFIRPSGKDTGKIGVVVGDVVGHGIAAALLMTTVRALVRSRAFVTDGVSETLKAVNELLYDDTAGTGSFVTLFYLMIDSEKHEYQWIRAGHDPAIVYDPQTDTLEELRGKGMALGVQETMDIPFNQTRIMPEGQIILVATDGLWETENDEGIRIGTKWIEEILRENKDKSSKAIVNEITRAVSDFRQNKKQHDDITMVIIKRTKIP